LNGSTVFATCTLAGDMQYNHIIMYTVQAIVGGL